MRLRTRPKITTLAWLRSRSTISRRLASNRSPILGDSASSQWYPAGYFGDADLRNNDVNNAFYASLGIRTPFSYTDVFDAMDVFPPDDPAGATVGGDGQIRYLDWQYILRRSLRLDTNNFTRSWAEGGRRVCQGAPIGSTAGTRIKSALQPAPGDVWYRQARVYSPVLTNVIPGFTCTMPVYVDVAAGCSLAGLSFRAVAVAQGDAPPVTADLTVTPASGKPAPMALSGLSPNEKLVAWSISSSKFAPPLQGKGNLVCYLGVRIPLDARPGQSYRLRFPVVDGAPNLTTQYDFESLAGTIWVGGPALSPQDRVTDQWKANFFGSAESPRAEDSLDDDGDGVLNWEEYQAGTDPTSRESRLQVAEARRVSLPTPGVAVTWLSASGRRYVVERAARLTDAAWTPDATDLLGNGQMATWVDASASGQSMFYRVRVQP